VKKPKPFFLTLKQTSFMENLRITNGFPKLSDAGLKVRTNEIIAGVTANFATAPGLAALVTANTNFTDALSAAINGGKYEKALKNQYRTELIEQLHLMGNYVLYTCAGDRAMAISSGFSIAKAPSPAPEVSKAENQKLDSGQNAGELKYSFAKVPGARSYVYQATQEPLTESSDWNSHMGTQRKFLFAGLESGKRYWVRVAAVGIAGQAVYSDPLSRLVQ
jgi:hypothetical protein